MSKIKKFYVVEIGRNPGIYYSWSDCEAEVKGFPNAKFKKYNFLEDAKEAFANGIDYAGTKEEIELFNNNILNDSTILSIYVDGACSGNPGIGEYRAVYKKDTEIIFSSNSYLNTTNNLMEFFALVEAMKFVHTKNLSLPIFSDSKSAIAWVRNKKVNTSLKWNEENEDSRLQLEENLNWLNTININNFVIIKWDTKKQGEIYADFGRK